MEEQMMQGTSDAKVVAVSKVAMVSFTSDCDVTVDDTKISDASTISNFEDPMDTTDTNSCDAWEDDSSYYNIPEPEEEEDEPKIETFKLFPKSTQAPIIDIIRNQPNILAMEQNQPEIIEINDESFEENNNDPNNNTGTMGMNNLEPQLVVAQQQQQQQRHSHSQNELPVTVIMNLTERAESPQPGCSKDSDSTQLKHATSSEPPQDDAILEKTRHILTLMSKVHRDSIFDALTKNHRVSLSDLRLWDLLPEAERLDYPEIQYLQKELDYSARCNESRMEPPVNGAKKRSGDDICTVESKKSSSVPNLAVMSTPAVPPPSVPKISSSSHVSCLYARASAQRGAIPKIRDDHLGSQQSTINTTRNALTTRVEQDRQVDKQSVYGKYTHERKINNEWQVAQAAIKRERFLSRTRDDTPNPVAKRLPVILKQTIPEFERSKPINVPTLQMAPDNRQTPNERESEIAKDKQQHDGTKKICMEMYYKLRVIFPNVDPNYIKKLCPADWGQGDRDAQIAPLVEHLLESGDSLPQAPINERKDLAETISNNPDDIYENLIGIFPDADPHYLREFAVTNIGKPEALKNFVETKLERRDYPTREQYLARLKITEQQRQYTTGFDVKQFLSIIPNPADYFLDPQRRSMHQTVAFEFLKSHYNRNRVTTISKIYGRCNYNLSLTAKCLERLGVDLKSKRGGYEMPTEDIQLLQEMAFIKHKDEINTYIENVKKAEDEEFRSLKAMNQLLECQCCYDSECLPSKCSPCDGGHIFCNSCVVAGTNAKMAEDETRIRCFVNCGSEFSLSVLQRVLAPTTFSILLKKRQAAEVIEAGLEGLVSCPFCHFASIPPEGDKIFKCLNPECTKESCRLCKELSHVPLKCDEVMKADNARHFIEEKMTEALARKCYKCQRAFFKEEGCNKITCLCGAIMCYLCDQPIKDYSHFRGQGSEDRQLCPLYSDTIRLDAVAVRKVAEEAQLQLLKRNPNIKIDTTNLLPAIPRPIRGPHNDVLNADELPRRAQRVLDLPPL